MKLFIVGVNSPTGKELIEVLRRRKIRFQAPADKHFEQADQEVIAKMISDYQPDQIVNLADFISGNHSALKRAEKVQERCYRINARLPAILSKICQDLDIPMVHLSNSYVFDGEKKLGYNENDEPNPLGVYGTASLEGERAVQQHTAHIIIRSGWLFGRHKKGLIKSWIKTAIRNKGVIQVGRRRFSPTHTGDLAAAIVAICLQVDCDASLWGIYHYSGLETKTEGEFAELTLRYAANHDESIYQLSDNKKLIERDVRLPEIQSATLSTKKITDTFGIKPKSWHGHLKETIKLLYTSSKSASASSEELPQAGFDFTAKDTERS
ncbi:MAG: dTDP-4-dehydrorhamnose reductase [Pseudohongiellaceae bacterium]|jgi:dTDP-4-dehydrorhamnose reductase